MTAFPAERFTAGVKRSVGNRYKAEFIQSIDLAIRRKADWILRLKKDRSSLRSAGCSTRKYWGLREKKASSPQTRMTVVEIVGQQLVRSTERATSPGSYFQKQFAQCPSLRGRTSDTSPLERCGSEGA